MECGGKVAVGIPRLGEGLGQLSFAQGIGENVKSEIDLAINFKKGMGTGVPIDRFYCEELKDRRTAAIEEIARECATCNSHIPKTKKE